MRYYYSIKSAGDHGSLYQLRNCIGRTSVVKKPLDNFNACDDFFVLVVKCHILTAAMEMVEIVMRCLILMTSTTKMLPPESLDYPQQPLSSTVTVKLILELESSTN